MTKAWTVIAVCAVHCGLLAGIAGLVGLRNPLFAVLLSWFLLTWVVCLGVALDLHLPESWYELRPFEVDGRAYERLGVPWAKRLLRRGPLSVFSRGMRLPSRPTRADLARLDKLMRNAETGHVIAFSLGVVPASAGILLRWWDWVAWLVASATVFNAYPVMVQRHNRARLRAALDRQPGASA